MIGQCNIFLVAIKQTSFSFNLSCMIVLRKRLIQLVRDQNLPGFELCHQLYETCRVQCFSILQEKRK